MSRVTPVERCSFLISELSTLGMVCYVASKLWYKTNFPAATWGLVSVAWVLMSIGRSFWIKQGSGRPGEIGCKCLLLLLAVGICAVAAKTLADPFSWRQAGAFGVMFLFALGFNRVLLGLIRVRRHADSREGLRFGIAQGAALFAVHPYIRSALMGAGDANSYSLLIADFIEQRRSGIFPVFVGQSWFSFNGGFHPIRTAPYLQHLSWLFSMLSFGTLDSFALLNLTVLASMLGAIVGCYAALRIFLTDRPWTALALAVLYGLCPGVLAPLYEGDMYLTFMTLPFLPWLVLGIAESTDLPDRFWPWALQSVALAAIWLAHPPIAEWATFVVAASAGWTIIRDHRWKIFRRMVLALGLFLVLSGYLFVSVYSLALPGITRASALASEGHKMSVLRANWAGSFGLVGRGGGHLLSDLQLGYGLWACLAFAAAAGAFRARTGRVLLGCFAFLVLFAWPIPFLTRSAWHILPSQMLLTNPWPIERLYVLLGALSIFAIASMFRSLSSHGRWGEWGIGGLLLLSVPWSVSETRKFFEGAPRSVNAEEASEARHRHQGIILSRTHSYEYLSTPSYFSNGHMDPRLETRLLDIRSQQPFADGSTYRPGSVGPPFKSRTLILEAPRNNRFDESVRLEPLTGCILRFDFLGQNPAGELQVEVGGITNFYTLPQSGYTKAFGSGPENGRSLIIENNAEESEDVTFRFVGQEAGSQARIFARVSVEPLAPETRAIRLESLTPFHTFVSAGRACYLETPKLFIPGYSAVVDGVETRCSRSAEGLLEVPLAKGEHEVRITYKGGRLLRLSYFGSAFAWILLAGAIGFCAFGAEPTSRLSRGSLRRSGFGDDQIPSTRSGFPLTVLWIFILALGAGLGLWHRSLPGVHHGDIRMAIVLPLTSTGRTEPLVTTGRKGAGDFIYLTYIDESHIQVGHDKWGFGGAKSAPIAVDYGKVQIVEVSMSSLYPDAPGDKIDRLPAEGVHPALGKLSIRWNGVIVLSEETLAYPSKPSEVAVGENTIGGSTTESKFSGNIVHVSRIDTR